MTEDEAKTRWCPFARVDSTAANRPNPGPNADTEAGWPPCIGSSCMAWRWLPVLETVRESVNRGTLNETSINHQIDTGRRSATDGYCGLAGRP